MVADAEPSNAFEADAFTMVADAELSNALEAGARFRQPTTAVRKTKLRWKSRGENWLSNAWTYLFCELLNQVNWRNFMFQIPAFTSTRLILM
jgi:hypothetical protein